ncbi:hypothetical protein F5B20DRAFT_591096 [Whalleya microplaca]|nr:hypothetical protein F5B20DRAFT_591096 [Whalleya microplaca]
MSILSEIEGASKPGYETSDPEWTRDLRQRFEQTMLNEKKKEDDPTHPREATFHNQSKGTIADLVEPCRSSSSYPGLESPHHLSLSADNLSALDSESPTFLAFIVSVYQIPMKWENPLLRFRAMQKVPLAQFQEKAGDDISMFESTTGLETVSAWGFKDYVVRAMMLWFKISFFSWVSDSPPCKRCSNPTVFCGNVLRTPNESAQRAMHVEQYIRTESGCGAIQRFPRYSDPGLLMEVRQGRAGESANCFGALCRAFGYRVRWIWSDEHAWLEIYSEHAHRWVHADPVEGVWDNPLLYTESQGRTISSCIAFSTDGVVDVTPRYLRRSDLALEYNILSGEELSRISHGLTADVDDEMNEQDRNQLRHADIVEQTEPEGSLTSVVDEVD